MDTFKAARWRLTLWYVVISYTLLALFTVAAILAEKQAFSQVVDLVHTHVRGVVFNVYLQQQIDEFEATFSQKLLIFDVVMLVAATLASYFLSGRTLKPIERMVHEQEQFAADASHELRTPLSNIAMEIEAHRRSQRSDSDDAALLDSISVEVNRMRAMVAGLLSLVRPQQAAALRQEVVDISQVVAEAVASTKPRFEQKQLEVTERISKDLQVRGHADELRQVVLILLDNAVKYTPKKGQVEVRLWPEDNGVRLVVRNSGATLQAGELHRVFERFYRGRQSRESGVGLGLAIAKQLVEAHSGSIAVASNERTGTAFRVIVPLLEERKE